MRLAIIGAIVGAILGLLSCLVVPCACLTDRNNHELLHR
jgi:hypothetical protein